MDINRVYGVNSERVQPLQRVQKVNLPSFEQQREDIAKHFSSQAEEKQKPKNYSHFLRQNYAHSRFHQTIQPYGFKRNEHIASGTCIYVDHTTIKQMTTYAANHEGFFWEDMGFDGNCKWVVIKGQRFECEFTEEEITRFEQMFEGTEYVKYLSKDVVHTAKLHILVSFDKEKRLQFMRLGNHVEHPKIQTLDKNIGAKRFIQCVMDFYDLKQLVFMV